MTTATTPIPSAAYRQALMLLQRQQRAQMTTLIAQTEAAIAADWQRGGAVVAQYYAPFLDRYARALDDLRRSSDDPAAALSLDWLRGQQSTLKSIEASAAKTINTTAAQSTERITEAQSAAVQRGASDAYALGQRALSPAFEEGYPPGVLFNRPNPDALAQWVGRAGTGHPLGDLFANFAPQAASEARKAMMLGLTMGDNPRAMARGLANALGISRSRALIISRTEVLGSYRSAAHETYRNNSDVLNGWLWSAGGANPCSACMGMDGLIFSLEESLLDHPCGKCAPLPVTKPWSDILGPLGIDVGDMPETSLGVPGSYFGGEEKFRAMPEAQQRAIIGTRTGYEAYKRGEVSLRDFVGRRPDGMIYQKSLRELQIPTERSARLVYPSPLTAGVHKLMDRGVVTPLEQMPAWARATPARQQVYQILRNGLPWQLSAQHERPLLMMNLEEMLKEADLPLNVRLAAMRQLDVLREYETYLKNNLWNVWHTAASTLERPGEFVYSPTKRLERELAAARAAARAGEQTAAREAAQVGEQAATNVVIRDAEEFPQASRDLFGRELSHDELARLVGAPDGAQVVVGVNEDGSLDVLLHGPSWNPEMPGIKSEYDAYRLVARDSGGKLYVHNINIDVAPGAQGQGFGAQLLYRQASELDKLGISYIRTDGAGSFGSDHVGYYAMPRYGFTGKLDEEYLQKIAAAVGRGELPESYGNYTTIEDLMKTAQGREWWRVNGGDIMHLKFDVTPGSYSMRTLQQYLRERGLS